jgi:hypothetical protein
MRSEAEAGLIAELRRRGLAAPARLLLDAHRPLRPLLRDTATFLAPLGRPFLGSRLDEIEGALDDDAAYDRLVRSLDDDEGPP